MLSIPFTIEQSREAHPGITLIQASGKVKYLKTLIRERYKSTVNKSIFIFIYCMIPDQYHEVYFNAVISCDCRYFFSNDNQIYEERLT